MKSGMSLVLVFYLVAYGMAAPILFAPVMPASTENSGSLTHLLKAFSVDQIDQILKEILKGLKMGNISRQAEPCIEEIEKMAKQFMEIGAQFENAKEDWQWRDNYFELTKEISKSGEALNVCFNALDDAVIELLKYIGLWKGFYDWGEAFFANALGKILTWKNTYDEMSVCVADENWPCIGFYSARILYLVLNFRPSEDMKPGLQLVTDDIIETGPNDDVGKKLPYDPSNTIDNHGDFTSSVFKQMWGFLEAMFTESYFMNNPSMQTCRNDVMAFFRICHDFGHDFDNLTDPLKITEEFISNFSEIIGLFHGLNYDCYTGGVQTSDEFIKFAKYATLNTNAYLVYIGYNIGNIYNNVLEIVDCSADWQPACAGGAAGKILKKLLVAPERQN
jgi:hypothetical protein